MISFLLILNFVFPLYIILKKCVYNWKVEINHIFLFSLGYLYYFVFPILVGTEKMFLGKPAMDIWYATFNRIPPDSIIKYLSFILLIYFSFIIGSLTNEKLRIKKESQPVDLFFHKSVLNFYFLIFVTFALFFIIRLRNSFFTGYTSVESLDFSQKGPFIALSLLILALAIIYTTKREQDKKQILHFHKLILNKFFLFYFIISLLVLSMGGRLYFASSLIMLLIYKTVYFQKIKLKNLIGVSLVLALFMASIGIMRSNLSEISLENMLFNLLQEPLYTSFSLISFLDSNVQELINYPIFLLSELINIVPTFILPNKLSYTVDPIDYGYFIYNPLGAMNSYVSFIINFGLLGTLAVLFSLGFLLESLKRKKNNILSKTFYIMISGFLTFTFFRDGFATSVVKNMFQFSLVLPLLIILSAHIISIAVKKRYKKNQ